MLKEQINAPHSKESANKAGILGKIVIILLFISLVGACAWLFINYQKAQEQVDYLSALTPQDINKKEMDALLEKVNKLIVLPEDKIPTIATIQNIEELAKEQVFFEKAQNGDKILIYDDRAIIYSPLKNILVNVGPVYTENSQQDPNIQNENVNNQANNTISNEIIIDIRNGSETIGLAADLKNKLINKKDYKIMAVSNASRKDYTDNIIVNPKNKDISGLEKEFSAQVVYSLPSGEIESIADVVIILGNKKESAPTEG